MSKGERKGERCEWAAAMVRVSSTRPKMAPNRMSLPVEGGVRGRGREERRGVRIRGRRGVGVSVRVGEGPGCGAV